MARIALDGSDLTTDTFDGTTMYARALMPRLIRVLGERGHTVDVHVPGEPTILLPPNARILKTAKRRFWTQTVLSGSLFRTRPDLLFLPIQTVPLYRPASMKVVAVIHDVDFLDYSNMFTLQNLFLLRWFTRVVVRNATRIIAVSRTTKDRVTQQYARNKNDIVVVHHGVDHDTFFMPPEDEREEKTARIRKRYAIPRDTILYVGAIQPRKNIPSLVAAFERLREEGRDEHLVIVGGKGWQEGDIVSALRASKVRSAIHLLRAVPRDDLAALYWNASVFVLPSFAEGFGMPVLEAMACGTPVVISRTPALEEIAGGAAETADPHDATHITNAIRKIIQDPVRRKERIAQGIERARTFSWNQTAEDTASVIEEALE